MGNLQTAVIDVCERMYNNGLIHTVDAEHSIIEKKVAAII